jgi:deoxyuridine 5'-triphosphate nucleotidohydrolase
VNCSSVPEKAQGGSSIQALFACALASCGCTTHALYYTYTCVRVLSKGLAWKKHVDVGAGVIDRDYTGNIGVVLFNHAQESLFIKHGDRIAQLILERHLMVDVEEVSSISETERGSGGFGSTGMSKIPKTEENSDVKTSSSSQ